MTDFRQASWSLVYEAPDWIVINSSKVWFSNFVTSMIWFLPTTHLDLLKMYILTSSIFFNHGQSSFVLVQIFLKRGYHFFWGSWNHIGHHSCHHWPIMAAPSPGGSKRAFCQMVFWAMCLATWWLGLFRPPEVVSLVLPKVERQGIWLYLVK